MESCFCFGVRFLGIAATLIAFNVSKAPCQDGTDSQKDKSVPVNVRFEISRQNVLAESFGNMIHLESDLGSLDAGNQARITVTIKNTMSEPIKFSSFDRDCGCSDLRVSGFEIRENEEIVLTASVPVPLLSDRTQDTFRFALLDDEKNIVVNVLLRFSLGGLIKFRTNRVLLLVPYGKNFENVFVPLTITDPVILENLSVQSDQDLRDLVFKLEYNSSDMPGVRVTAARAMIDDGPVFGKVTCVDSVTRKADSFHLSVRARDPIIISPAVSWLRKQFYINESRENGQSTIYRSHALVSIDESFLQEIAGDEADSVEIAVKSEKFPKIKSEIKKLRSNLFRVILDVEIDHQKMTKETDVLEELIWEFRFTNESSINAKSHCRIER